MDLFLFFSTIYGDRLVAEAWTNPSPRSIWNLSLLSNSDDSKMGLADIFEGYPGFS